ncbi:hypothetical protein [Aquibacillus albus]|uniref:Uncharacterized protein n=1 Tax=Aquibacillus albus TaxID=1168171 RepID=A0ABS2MXY4_9BACI|nr:hypothetical protein [Aquibacillus albus]MBM7570755.1 hypothetical protein [Aquibacillus albus]
MEHFANLTEEELQKIAQLEEELGVILLAYKDETDQENDFKV